MSNMDIVVAGLMIAYSIAIVGVRNVVDWVKDNWQFVVIATIAGVAYATR